MSEKFFDQKVKELVLRYNYTLNVNGVYEAIKYMYTYWPNPKNTTFIREQYIHVSYKCTFPYRFKFKFWFPIFLASCYPIFGIVHQSIKWLNCLFSKKCPSTGMSWIPLWKHLNYRNGVKCRTMLSTSFWRAHHLWTRNFSRRDYAWIETCGPITIEIWATFLWKHTQILHDTVIQHHSKCLASTSIWRGMVNWNI